MSEKINENSIREELTLFGVQTHLILQRACFDWKSNLTKAIHEITAPTNKLSEKARSTSNNSIKLAGAMLNHDIKDYAQLVNTAAYYAYKDDAKVPRLFARIQTFKSLCITVSYVATQGKSDCQIPLLPTNLEEMLDAKNHHLMILPKTPKIIHSPEFVGALQLINNSKHKNRLHIALGKENYHFYFQIDDTGTGLVDKEGKPLQKHEIRNIFKGYTTKESDHKQHGLGLQIASEIARLRGGYVSVRSTAEDGTTKTYRTDTEETTETKDSQPRGCTFVIYFKKDL